jgi:predicted porin
MQKKLIALAVASLMSGAAFAQSNVTISGNIFMGYDSNSTSGVVTTAGFGTVNRVSDHSSSIVFAGTEDLGGGMKAVFQIDSRPGFDFTGGTWAGGNTHVGLTGNWGGFRMGKQDMHYHELGVGLGTMRVRSLQSMIGAGMMSEVNGVAITPRTRANNFMWYNSPNMSGFNVMAGVSTSAFATEGVQTVDGSRGFTWTGTAKYANGPFNMGYSHWAHNEEGGNGATAGTVGSDQRSNRLWARYAFAMGLELGLGYDSSKYDSDATNSTNFVKRNAYQLAGKYSTGANAFYLQYASAGNTSGAGLADTGSGAHTWLLGYDYALSKRTNVGISYTHLRNKQNGTYDFFQSPVGTTAGARSTQLHLGMSHSF